MQKKNCCCCGCCSRCCCPFTAICTHACNTATHTPATQLCTHTPAYTCVPPYSAASTCAGKSQRLQALRPSLSRSARAGKNPDASIDVTNVRSGPERNTEQSWPSGSGARLRRVFVRAWVRSPQTASALHPASHQTGWHSRPFGPCPLYPTTAGSEAISTSLREF